MAQYSVFMDGQFRVFFEEQIRPLVVNKTNWVDRETFRSYLTSCLINTPSARNLYSLNAARIDYVPYQFRPALKILKADEPRILIADSVGVGKTIEAGLIIKELQAHSGLNRIAIICPKPLVAERKWEDEMRERFDEDFVALDGPMLRQALSDTDRDGEWPARLSRVIIPYSILDETALTGNKDKVSRNAKGRIYGFEDVFKYLNFNLVIADEAHHIRNGSVQKEKAFAYKCTKLICDRSDAVVMLTATPLQNSNRDLYTLLNVLRPDLIIDEQTFQLMAEPNPHVSHISQLARVQGDGWRGEALAELDKIAQTGWGQAYIIKNPNYVKCRAKLERTEELTREERVAFISDVEELHSFNSMINRTRRRDIEDFCIRETKTIEIPFTKPQYDLHEALLTFEHKALAALHGDRLVKFMMTTLKRQAASCIFGLAPHIGTILNRRLAQIDSADAENSAQELELSSSAVELLRELAGKVLELAQKLPTDDPKFDAVLKVVREKQSMPRNKVMIFSTFRHTLNYIQKKFLSAGVRVDRVDGDVKDEVRRELRRRFKLPKDDPDAIDVMLFTEVGSEGLDYQFCDMMVNYDLPWNPMAIEQRIGRIDRRKQMSEKVWIVNVITPGTVDADIYNRCLMKVGVFTESIGECEEILGEVEGDIKAIVFDSGLTEEQRRLKLEQLADNVVRRQQVEEKLEEEQKSFFGLDLNNFKDSKAIEEAKSPWLTPECLLGLVTYYLNERIGPGSYILGGGARKTLRLGVQAKEKLLQDLLGAKLPMDSQVRRWTSYLKGAEQTCTVTFDRQFAQEDPSAIFFTPVHPLVKVAASCFEKNNNASEPCIAFRCRLDDVAPGRYPFAVYAWKYSGFTSQFKMVTVPLDEKLQEKLPAIVQSAESFELSGDASDLWADIDPLHSMLWRKEKDSWIEETRAARDYKLQTAHLSFSRKKAALEKKIVANADPRSTLMFQTQLANDEERYEAKINRINSLAERADIVSQKIANGMIIVEE
jgi:superfamily II DNA or RNA helicase